MKHCITKREHEVLQLIDYEHNAKEIGQKLFISIETVKSHRKNLILKLDVKNTAGLVRKGIQNGLILSEY